MKIIIPVEKKSREENVADVFGRAKYFAIVDIDTDTVDFIENIGAKSPNGAGIKAAQQVIDLKANVVILPRIGKNGAKLLEAANIKLYKNVKGSVDENVGLFTNAKLQLLDEIHSGFHGSK